MHNSHLFGANKVHYKLLHILVGISALLLLLRAYITWFKAVLWWYPYPLFFPVHFESIKSYLIWHPDVFFSKIYKSKVAGTYAQDRVYLCRPLPFLRIFQEIARIQYNSLLMILKIGKKNLTLDIYLLI